MVKIHENTKTREHENMKKNKFSRVFAERSEAANGGEAPRSGRPFMFSPILGIASLCHVFLSFFAGCLVIWLSGFPVFAAKEISLKFLFVIDGFSEERKFAAPMGVFFDKYHDEIYVADTGNNQVDVFDASGQPLFQIRNTQGLRAPLDVVVNRDNQIYVSQMERSCLQLFNFRGEHLTNLYSLNAAPFKPGRMCLDAEEKLYLVERKSENFSLRCRGQFPIPVWR